MPVIFFREETMNADAIIEAFRAEKSKNLKLMATAVVVKENDNCVSITHILRRDLIFLMADKPYIVKKEVGERAYLLADARLLEQ